MTGIVRGSFATLVFFAPIVLSGGWKAAGIVVIALGLALATVWIMSAGEEG